VFFRGRFLTKFWFNRTSKIGAVDGVIFGSRFIISIHNQQIFNVSVHSVTGLHRREKRTYVRRPGKEPLVFLMTYTFSDFFFLFKMFCSCQHKFSLEFLTRVCHLWTEEEPHRVCLSYPLTCLCCVNWLEFLFKRSENMTFGSGLLWSTATIYRWGRLWWRTLVPSTNDGSSWPPSPFPSPPSFSFPPRNALHLLFRKGKKKFQTKNFRGGGPGGVKSEKINVTLAYGLLRGGCED
jgi:hypothetical protein